MATVDSSKLASLPVATVENENEIVDVAHVEELIEALDHNRETISTGEDGRAALEMVLALHESEQRGNARVDFPMQSRDLQVLVRPDNFISTAVPQNI